MGNFKFEGAGEGCWVDTKFVILLKGKRSFVEGFNGGFFSDMVLSPCFNEESEDCEETTASARFSCFCRVFLSSVN